MNTAQLIRKGFLGLLGLFFSASLWAHGGAAVPILTSVNLNCSPPIGFITRLINRRLFQRKNFAATCGTNTLTQLVFDYQDMKYRNMLVEFEVTKEPEGKRVFFLPSAKHKKGSVNLELPNGVPEPGNI